MKGNEALKQESEGEVQKDRWREKKGRKEEGKVGGIIREECGGDRK